ncbi:hypothetical protein [Levilactobacillus fujinensis]|uniref:Uncharacterized protein n=1 Tax=Levilactobacillus fujinensis TaxID=2486024 RepID=A0ABW1TE73_9LACO|nr:hypothetical protein [Levilactobacillus fujinensis]
MKISTTLCLIIAAFTVGAAGLGTQAQAKSSAVKIGKVMVPREYLHTNTFYRAKKAVTIKITANHTDGTYATKTVKIPKNTVVSGRKINLNSKDQTLWINLRNELSYHVLKTAFTQHPGYVPSVQNLSVSPQAFKKVKRPVSLPTWSYGDFYLGGKSAIAKSTTTQEFQFTSDGYLEIHKYVAANGTTTPRPTQSAKIKRVQVSGSTRYYYFSKKIKGLTLKHVTQHGQKQYRLTVRNLHQPQHRAGFSDDDIPGTYYSLYKLGSKTTFTPIAEDTIY